MPHDTQHTPAQAREQYIRAHMADVPAKWLRHMPATTDAAELKTCERLVRGEMASNKFRAEMNLPSRKASARVQRALERE